jgi:hypothetical protein
MAFDAAQLTGGPHDGERIVHPPASPIPDRLEAISFDDGARYARTGQRVDENNGETVVLLCYDGEASA